jgi:hypothetical protein
MSINVVTGNSDTQIRKRANAKAEMNAAAHGPLLLGAPAVATTLGVEPVGAGPGLVLATSVVELGG